MQTRSSAAIDIARQGGTLALSYFAKVASLKVVDKGTQDFVSEADQNVELHVRSLIEAQFPDDGIVGEEHAPKPSKSGYHWVIDPIDGTTNFLNAIPAWTVVLAVVKDDETQVGVIFDPIHEEMFHAERAVGATLNGATLRCPVDAKMNRGSVGTGYCNRVSKAATVAMIGDVLALDGVFHRNASGALSLAYVAAGRLIGYLEEHMNAWDCIAGQLIIGEAGGRVETQSADQMIAQGGRVVAGSAGVFDDLVQIADRYFPD